jgi:hypothetical protein
MPTLRGHVLGHRKNAAWPNKFGHGTLDSLISATETNSFRRSLAVEADGIEPSDGPSRTVGVVVGGSILAHEGRYRRFSGACRSLLILTPPLIFVIPNGRPAPLASSVPCVYRFCLSKPIRIARLDIPAIFSRVSLDRHAVDPGGKRHAAPGVELDGQPVERRRDLALARNRSQAGGQPPQANPGIVYFVRAEREVQREKSRCAMRDEDKTRQQLIAENEELRRRVTASTWT